MGVSTITLKKKKAIFVWKIEYKRVIPNYSCMYYILLYVIRSVWLALASIATKKMITNLVAQTNKNVRFYSSGS